MTTIAKQWQAMYRTREAVFGAMPEPQWRMLVDLAESGRCTVGSICIASGAPLSTARRHLECLQESGLIERSPHGHDRRSGVIALSPTGADRMADLQARILREDGGR